MASLDRQRERPWVSSRPILHDHEGFMHLYDNYPSPGKILRRTWPLPSEELRGEDGGEDLAVGWGRLVVAVAAGRGEGDVDGAPVLAAQTALDQPVFLQPVDQPGQRALAQVDRFGQLLG